MGAAADEKHEFQADGAGIVEREKSKTDDIDSNQNTEEVEKDIKNNEAQSPNQSGIKRRACVRNLKLGGIQNTDSNTQAIKATEEKVLQETTKSLEINAAKPNKEEITSSKLIVEAEPEVGDPCANLINNTKEVSSTSSGAKNVDISSKSGLTLRKPDPKSKDPKDESSVGETKDEDKAKEEVLKNKEVSEQIGSNNNKDSMSKVNICK